MYLVVNGSKERRNKFRKKVESGDVSSLESYYECVLFQLPGQAKIEFQADPTRAKSVHDTNLSEIRDLLLSILGKKISIPKIVKVKNAPFIRRIVHLHVSDVPPALNANTIYSVGGSKALITSLSIGEPRCVRVDKEIDEFGQLPFKLLTIPYSKAAELSHVAPDGIPHATLKDDVKKFTENGGSECSEEQQAAADLAQYVLSPAQLHLWGYPPIIACVDAIELATVSDAVEADRSEDSEECVGKRPHQDPQTGANKRAKVLLSEAAVEVCCKPTYIRGCLNEYLPATDAEAHELLHAVGLVGCEKQVGELANLDVQFSTLPPFHALFKLLRRSVGEEAMPLVVAVDCEMCLTTLGSELTRVSLLGYDGSLLLDTLVKPAHPIVDYRTPFSGITEELLKNVDTTLLQVQVAILRLISAETILIGHSLDSDLRALRMSHARCIDTAISYPHPRGYPLRLKLRKLAEDYLQLRIQANIGGVGHDSTEDAKAALQLAMLKAANGPLFGVKKPDQQRCPVLGVLDSDTTDAVLFWQDKKRVGVNAKVLETDQTKIAKSIIEVVAVNANICENVEAHVKQSASALSISATAAAVIEEEIGHSVNLADVCVGGNATSRVVNTSWEVVNGICGEIRSRRSSCFSISTTDDKSAGPVASWVGKATCAPTCQTGAVDGVKSFAKAVECSLSVPKCMYFFGNLTHPTVTSYAAATVATTASSSASTVLAGQSVLSEKEKEFVSTLNAQIEKIRAICAEDSSNPHLGSGNTLLLVTAQDSLDPVLSLLHRKRTLSRATMATAMWSAEEEMNLREMRKHNIAYLSASVL